MFRNRKPTSHHGQPLRGPARGAPSHTGNAPIVPSATTAIIVGAGLATALAIGLRAAVPALVVLSGSSLAGSIRVHRRPSGEGEWLSVQLLTAMTLGLFGWELRLQMGAVVATALIGVAGGLAALAVANYRLQLRVNSLRRRGSQIRRPR